MISQHFSFVAATDHRRFLPAIVATVDIATRVLCDYGSLPPLLACYAEPAEANVLAARHGADDGGREEVRECPVCGQQRPWYSIDAHVDKCLDGVLSD